MTESLEKQRQVLRQQHILIEENLSGGDLEAGGRHGAVRSRSPALEPATVFSGYRGR